MNEKMLELYKKAHISSTAIDPSNNMPYETTIFSAEKFSELIVKECVSLLPEDCQDIDGVHMCYKLKEHFGI